MKDRTDWPTLTPRGYLDEPTSIDKHPKPRSIRARRSFWTSNTRDGIALPCAYRIWTAGFRANIIATGFNVGSNVYYCSFARAVNQIEPVPAFWYWRWGERVEFSDLLKWTVFSKLFVWLEDEERWFEGFVRETGIPTLPGVNQDYIWVLQPLFTYASNVTPLIQCYLRKGDFERVQLPPNGPPDMPWPPVYDHWWTDQFSNASGASDQRDRVK